MDYKANDTKCNKEYDSKEQESLQGASCNVMQGDLQSISRNM